MKKLPVVIDVEEFTKLIKQTKRIDYKIIFLLGFGAGLRVSEVTKLEKRDINFKERCILVRQGKGKKDRIVPLPKGLKESHLKYIPLKIGIRQMQRAFKNTSKKAGLLKNKPDLHFHSLRHGFATRCVSEGMPIHHLRTLMGHTNISTTNVYLEANPQSALKSYEDLF